MSEQSDTPRTDAAVHIASDYDDAVSVDFARDLERALATATRERDEARALNAQWSEKAATWTASPEAAKRLQGYRDLSRRCGDRAADGGAIVNTLREAAQEALFWMQHARLHLTIKERLHPDGMIQYDNAFRNLRAALAQPENRPCTCHPDDNPPQPCAQRYALTECKALAQPETAEPVAWAVMCDGANCTQICLTETAANLIAENMREHNRGRDFDWQTTPLYAHPPRDEWRPASEPPEDGRDVVVWMNDGGHGCFAIGHCLRGEWTPNYVGSPVIRWRDVQPPTEVAK